MLALCAGLPSKNTVMNRWKIAFWICFLLLLATAAFGFYSIIDQGMTITYERESYSDIDGDLRELVQIINNTDLSRDKIRTEILKSEEFNSVNCNTDTIYLNSIGLIFKDDKLFKVWRFQ
jgi:hypothetical protein